MGGESKHMPREEDEKRLELFQVPFMKAWMIIRGESYNPRIEMPPAAVVLPYEAGHVYLFKTPHPDTGVLTLKTVGGYCKEGETPMDCASRNLEARLGLRTMTIEYIGPVLSYVHARIPTHMYLAGNLSHVADWAPPPGTERVRVNYDEAYDLVVNGMLLDDASSIPIMRLLLRAWRYKG